MEKKTKNLAMHEKDTGSSEVQVALLTDKSETVLKNIKQSKKYKYSFIWFLRSLNIRKKLL